MGFLKKTKLQVYRGVLSGWGRREPLQWLLCFCRCVDVNAGFNHHPLREGAVFLPTESLGREDVHCYVLEQGPWSRMGAHMAARAKCWPSAWPCGLRGQQASDPQRERLSVAFRTDHAVTFPAMAQRPWEAPGGYPGTWGPLWKAVGLGARPERARAGCGLGSRSTLK